MTPEQWKRVKEIYKQLHGLPKEEQEAKLRGMCEGDQEIGVLLTCLLNMPPDFLQREAPRPYDCTDIFLSPGEILADRWQIAEFLGRGGMADVYAADDKELGKKVALKVIRSDVSFDNTLLDRFKKEVELAQKVKHRNVCGVYDIGHTCRGSRELAFLTMELIPGETMAARLERTGPLDPSEWFPVAKQLCKAIQEAHRAKILHRDFKPGNVMLVGSGTEIRAIVTDFGIARAIGGEQDSSLGLTARSMILGTWPYMSPEQKRGEGLKETSDIYSLGLVLYEMITGLQYSQIPKLENIPHHLKNWRRAIGRCLEDDPAKRFRSALELLDALKSNGAASTGRPRVWRLLRIAATITIFALVVVTLSISRAPSSLPTEMHVAMIMPEARGDNNPENLVGGWFDTTAQKLNVLKDPHLSIIPLDDTIGILEGEIPSASKIFRFNVYITVAITKKGIQNDFEFRLHESGSGHLLRSCKASIRVNDSGSDLAQCIATLLQRKISLGPGDLPSDNRQALGFFERGKGYLFHRDLPNIDFAIGQFESAVKLDPQFSNAYAYLAFAYSLKYRQSPDPKSNAGYNLALGSLLGVDHDLPSAHLAVGLMAQSSGNLDGAIAEFRKVLFLSPSDHDVRSLLAMAYFQSGRIEDAKEALKEAIDRDDRYWFNYLDLGYVYYQNGELTNAEKEFREAKARAPDNPLPNANLAETCMCLGKYGEAEEILEKLFHSDKSAILEANLAAVYERKGDYKKAIEFLQDATEQRSNVDDYWLLLSDAYKLQNRNADAKQSLQEGLKAAQARLASNPNENEVRSRLALYLAKLGSKDAALTELHQAQKIAKTKQLRSVEFQVNLARVYELTDKRDEALNVIRSAFPNKCAHFTVETNPDFASLRRDRRYKEIVNQVSIK